MLDTVYNYMHLFFGTKEFSRGVQLSLSSYLWAVKLPPQNSGGAKKLGGSRAVRKRPIGMG
ncbi:hypothetical protein BW900_07235 [Bacillus mycoides]|uniref:Uncharacterized protein n=1 Tax=Bacillus mycoides TaxID=1405 RepID=A0A1S9TBQ1_BACMY|nr:hypothetical protein BW900_07235 [Bacillus mycoides]RAN67827.1 hypothetical protein B5P40_22670 [Bacillus sp. SRB_8]